MRTFDEMISGLKELREKGFVKTHRAGDTGIGKTLEDLFSCKRSVAFNITISCLNLNTIFDLFDWLYNNEYLYVANFVEEPTLLHINSLKPNEIEKFYAKHKKYRYPLTHLNDVAQYVMDNYRYDKKMNKKMETYLFALDIKRNTDRGILNG